MSIFQKWLPKFDEKRAESIMLQIPKKSLKKSLHIFLVDFLALFGLSLEGNTKASDFRSNKMIYIITSFII
jgi:hypothetical protein